MTYKQLKEAFSQLQFENSGKIIDNYEVKITKLYKKIGAQLALKFGIQLETLSTEE